jgi:hypothetical protein
MEILERKDSDTIQKDAIQKVIAIATSDQQHLQESQKITGMRWQEWY